MERGSPHAGRHAFGLERVRSEPDGSPTCLRSRVRIRVYQAARSAAWLDRGNEVELVTDRLVRSV